MKKICLISLILLVSLFGCSSGSSNGSVKRDSLEQESISEEFYPGEFSTANYKMADNSINVDKTINNTQPSKKLIVTGSLNLETSKFDETLESLNKSIAEVGGYVQYSSVNSYDDRRIYDATIRVPADKYSSFASKVKDSAKVTYYSENVEDITDTYTDLEAKQKSLKAEEEKVLEFYKQAKTIDELMSVEQRLTDIRYQIDSIESSLKNYDLLTSYSTLNVNITELNDYVKPNEGFFSRLSSAFVNSITNFINIIGDIIIFIVSNIWFILVILLVVYFVYKKRKNKTKKVSKK